MKSLSALRRSFRRVASCVTGVIALAAGFDCARARNPFDEICNGVAGPALAEWIRASSRDADQAGVQRIPTYIRTMIGTPALGGFENLTYERVRFRVGRGHVASLQSSSMRLPFAREIGLPIGHREAITLGDIIIFREETDANNVALWVHELRHVEQYAAKGTNDFAQEYCQNSGQIEADAQDRENSWAGCYRANSCGGPENYAAVGYVGFTRDGQWAGFFHKGLDGYWGEYNGDGAFFARWTEHYRSTDYIELYDRGRDLFIRLDMVADQVLITWPDKRYYSFHGNIRAIR